MKPTFAFVLGVGVGIAAIALLAPSKDECCTMLAHAARDKIAGYAGGASGAVAGFLDATGLTNALPALLNIFGVEKN